MLNPCYVHGTTHVHGYVHACSCMFVHVKFWLPYHPSLTGLRASTKQDMLSRMAGRLWNAETDEVRNHFMSLAAEEKKRHAEKYPGYSFMPKQICREGNTRQRVRSRRKKYDDDDDYTPSVQSPPPFLSNPRYSPYASSPSGSTSSSHHHFHPRLLLRPLWKNVPPRRCWQANTSLMMSILRNPAIRWLLPVSASVLSLNLTSHLPLRRPRLLIYHGCHRRAASFLVRICCLIA